MQYMLNEHAEGYINMHTLTHLDVHVNSVYTLSLKYVLKMQTMLNYIFKF